MKYNKLFILEDSVILAVFNETKMYFNGVVVTQLNVEIIFSDKK